MTHAPKPSAAAPDSAREIVSTRDLPFPCPTVYRAFSTPDLLARWWGPAGFTNRIETFDLRPGGRWCLTMIASDGTTYPNQSRFLEVDPPRRVVFVHEDPVHAFRMTLLFDDHGPTTRLTWQMLFDDAAEAARVRHAIVAANEQNFDRLLATLNSTP